MCANAFRGLRWGRWERGSAARCLRGLCIRIPDDRRTGRLEIHCCFYRLGHSDTRSLTLPAHRPQSDARGEQASPDSRILLAWLQVHPINHGVAQVKPDGRRLSALRELMRPSHVLSRE